MSSSVTLRAVWPGGGLPTPCTAMTATRRRGAAVVVEASMDCQSCGAGAGRRRRNRTQRYEAPAAAASRRASEISAALHDRLASPAEELAVPPPELRRATDVARLLLRQLVRGRRCAGWSSRIRPVARGLVGGAHAII